LGLPEYEGVEAFVRYTPGKLGQAEEEGDENDADTILPWA
jgi:hypothetical protein